jgi:hypothetical protein
VARPALAYTLLAACVLAALYAWEHGAYVNYAEGVYVESAHLALHGAVPYRDFVAAHPPLLFYSGAALLAISDTIDAIRIGLAVVSLVTGGLVLAAVLRLTRSAPAAVLAGLVALVTPWALHEHATLEPETLGAPLLLAAALLAARPRTAAWGGVVAAVAVGVKWPFLLPGLAIAAFAAARVRFLAGLIAGFVAGVLVSFALFGPGRLYHQLVVAQQDVGWHTLHDTGGLLVQAAWNLLPLLVPAVAGALLWRRTEEPVLARTVLALAATALVLVATVAKTGTYLNTVRLAEPPLVVLGASGIVLLARDARRHRAALAAIGVAVALGVAEIAAFVADPLHPGLFVRPGSAPAAAWAADAATVDRDVAAARRCTGRTAYSGAPYIAFLAGRPMPGGQPDGFLLAQTPVAAPFARAAAADRPVCP